MRGICSQLVLGFVGIACVAVAGARTAAIQYVEPVALDLAADHASFEAYGRHFALTLDDNGRVLQKLGAERKRKLAGYRLMRGTLAEAPGSWVRLTETPTGVEGAIWDGQELFAVTTYRRVAGLLLNPIDAAPDQSVVYRLSDLRDALPRDFCGNSAAAGENESTNGLDQYKGLLSELKASKSALSRQIEISLIGDTAFQAAEPDDPTAAMLARLNIVEGIFSEQLDLLVLATDVRLVPAGADPFTTSDGKKLLEQLGEYRAANAAVRARGVAHLITGRDLEGSTAGIAYVGSLCETKRGVSISEQGFGTTISALIMAHELGHNFGAPHDGEVGTACEGVGGGYIMAPSVSGFTKFSQCSVNAMNLALARASCVTQADYADAGISAAVPNVSSEGGLVFTLPFDVSSSGTRGAGDVVVTVTLPALAFLSIESATSSVGGCSVSGLTASCELGMVAVGESPRIEVNARSLAAAEFGVQARVRANGDPVSSNDAAALAVSIRSGIDVALSMSASAPEVILGAPLAIYADVSSLRAQAASNVNLSVNLNQAVTAASLPGGICTIQNYAVTCSLAELPAGATRRLTIETTTTAPGALYASGNVGASGDADLTNNAASASGWVQAERDVEIVAGAATVDLAVGAAYELPFTVRSRGPLPTGDVTVWISIPSADLVVGSLGGALCEKHDATTYRCDLGAVAPGTSRMIKLKAHAAQPATIGIDASAEAPGDEYGTNNYASAQLRVNHLVDLGIVMASGGTGVEDEKLAGQVSLRSTGRNAATGATLDIELHSAGTLHSASILNGTICKLVSAQHARCKLPTIERNTTLYVDYEALFEEPGNYDVRFTLTTPGDSAPENDTLERTILVRPFYDIAVFGNADLSAMLVGQTREKTFSVAVDRRDLASARFVAPHYLPGLRVDSIRATAGDCHVDEFVGGVCEFTQLPAFWMGEVTVTYRALEANRESDVTVSVSTPGDVVSANDVVRGTARLRGVTDVELRVNAEMHGAMGEIAAFPAIKLVNGADVAHDVRLEITLPPQVALIDVSAANALCIGTTVLRCDFSPLAANTTTTVNLNVRASASGRFTAGVRVVASNDTNAANDTRDVTVDVSAAATVTNPPAGKSGGGAFEWLTLALLALAGWLQSPTGRRCCSRTRRASRRATRTAR